MTKPTAVEKTIREHIVELEWFVVMVLLLVIAIQGYATIMQLSITTDETAYLTSGYATMVTGDMEFMVGTPHFIKYIISLPLFFRHVNLSTDNQEFKAGDYFGLGGRNLYAMQNDWRSIIKWGRLMILALSLVLAFFVYRWAKLLFGALAGVLALFIYTFEPNLIAHSTVATTDLGVSAFSFISAYLAWRFFKTRWVYYALGSGILLGFALGSKFTALAMIPVIVIMALFYKAPDAVQVKTAKSIGRWAGMAVLFSAAAFTLWAAYGFQFEPLKFPRDLITGSDALHIAARKLIPQYIGYFQGMPIPAASWVMGLFWQTAHAKSGQESYLFGQFSQFGWWYYYLVAFFLKLQIALIAMIAIGLWLLFRQVADRRDRLVLLLLPAMLLGMSFFSTIDIGVRYILPIIPFLIVFASQVVKFPFTLERRQAWLVAALCLWLAASSLLAFPEYLAYFNESIGGSKNGHKYLLDSNLDWGQDLIKAKQYLDENNIQAVKIVYFGTVNPAAYGVFPKPMSQQETIMPERDIYLISANKLYGLYSGDREAWGWARDLEPTDRIGASIYVFDLRE